MANTSISGLTASVANAVATDLFPVVQTAGVGPVKMTLTQVIGGILAGSDTQVQFNDGGTSFGGDAGLTYNKTTNALTLTDTGGVTFTNPVADTLQLGVSSTTPALQVLRGPTNTTVNGNGAAFYLKGGAGDGSGTGGALYLDGGISGAAGTGGAIIFRTAPATAGSTLATALTIDSTARVANIYGFSTADGSGAIGIGYELFSTTAGSLARTISTRSARWVAAGLVQSADAYLGWTSVNSNTGSDSGGVADAYIYRDAANIIALKNSTNAQEFRVYKTTTSNNYKAIVGDGNLIKISGYAFTDGAAAASGTLTNAPAAGNPTKWIPIDDNGTTRYIPAW